MHFQIPQFIDVEDKLIGPLGIKQFLYLVAAGGICFSLFYVLSRPAWFLMVALIGGVAVGAAFGKYNGQPLTKIAKFAFHYLWNPRFYLWQRQSDNQAQFEADNTRTTMEKLFSEMPSVKKLWTDLATSKNPIPKREKGLITTPTEQKEKYQSYRKTTGERAMARRVDYR